VDQGPYVHSRRRPVASTICVLSGASECRTGSSQPTVLKSRRTPASRMSTCGAVQARMSRLTNLMVADGALQVGADAAPCPGTTHCSVDIVAPERAFWNHLEMPFIRFSDVIAEFDHVDDPDVLERIKTSPALRIALEMTRPENWWGTSLDPNLLFRIAKEDGIPVAWVPPPGVLIDLAAAPDRHARMAVLLSREREIIDHCTAIVRACNDQWVAGERRLVEAAVAAYMAGHREAAMALAVSIGEPLAVWASKPRVQSFESEAERDAWEMHRVKAGRYGGAALELSTVGADLSRHELLQKILIAPIPRFFTPWFPNKGQPMPTGLSRHVVAHQATSQHFSRENALLAVMLVASILRAMQAWSEEVRSMEDP
jgi:hypothetical protein